MLTPLSIAYVWEEHLKNQTVVNNSRYEMRWLDSVLEATGMSLAKLREAVACSGPWGHEKSDTTERLNNNNSR